MMTDETWAVFVNWIDISLGEPYTIIFWMSVWALGIFSAIWAGELEDNPRG
jgi:hypothetical protein